jgi:hypothetical protein
MNMPKSAGNQGVGYWVEKPYINKPAGTKNAPVQIALRRTSDSGFRPRRRVSMATILSKTIPAASWSSGLA